MPAGKILKNLKNNPQGAPMHPSPEERGVSPNVSVPHPRSVWFNGDGHKTLTSSSPYYHQLAGFDALPVSFTCQGRVIITLMPLRDQTGPELSPPPAVSAYRLACKHGQQSCQVGKKKKIDFQMKSYFLPLWQLCCPASAPHPAVDNSWGFSFVLMVVVDTLS